MSSIPKIVIVGAGYGGILTAQQLQKELKHNEATVTLINRHDYHYITTHLHMPAAGTDTIEHSRIPIAQLIDEFKVDLVKGTVKEIIPNEKKVVLEDGSLSYDYLVIGLGGEPETFGIPGMDQFALTIRSINSVRLIREHIEYQLALYKNDGKPGRLNFVVGGAGFSGIEFVAELADRLPQLAKTYDIDFNRIQIINVEAAPTALPGFDPELVEYAMDVLKRKGVNFRIGVPIKECQQDGVIVGEGEKIEACTVVWTGGIRGNGLIEKAGFEVMRGRVKIDDFLRAPGHDDIFIIGDSSLMFNPEGRPYPPTAQIAMQQGVLCAKNLAATLRKKELHKFVFSNKGTVASLGKGEAVAVVGKRKIKGWVAAQLKKIVDLRYLFIIGGIPLVLKKGRFF
ncbi:NADH dehydrogenase [Paenibacillus jamilae]|mgnify:FL=1|jgi:NADH dehydrogenase|uniref:NAD(P)/FAD-dependent oxidoreductase n=1 Tax=Paenibacillus polymyxa TaxID=1406 RepID=UPI0008C3A28F|nr:NAD(P)/FAD-dependent oxidoreductase [Paenibacillus polymyxa]MDP9677961.1 NADH dehydrogenase [Paenibacillus jamilae]MBE3647872.1 NAD(P)/FAD-dependent oxidoreductase [Paenibacillus polymyxa]MBY0024810.1 NAD(P)/FAD-dependent oxidoreductase [Paenibacillus polymyxa]MBY0058360.1 NAD(P)/FAD-dependent oxidoreductase [Paenibacillus polymyxa]MBY0072890.1 NAD(P)/FAD-dependent oxidoreductase [Paenibacillus polymyxa]